MNRGIVATLALWSMLVLAGCKSRVDELLERLESPDPAVRERAIRGLVKLRYGDRELELPEPGIGAIPLRGDEPKIVRALTRVIRDDPDRHIRYWAAEAMVYLRPPGRNDVLLDCAANDPFAGDQCAWALLAVADPANLEDMVGMLGKDTSAGRNQMRDIGKVGEAVLPYLTELVRQDELFVASVAIYALEDVGTPDAYGVIAEALRSQHSFHRYSAIAALASAGATYRPVIAQYLTDPAHGVQAMAARVLGLPEPPAAPTEEPGAPPIVDAGALPTPKQSE